MIEPVEEADNSTHSITTSTGDDKRLIKKPEQTISIEQINETSNHALASESPGRVGPDKTSAEYIKLASRDPLPTICIQSGGPILSQIINAIYSIVDTIWISKAIGQIGMASVSTYSAFDTIGRAFGSFLGCAAATEISSLFGEGKGHEATQIFSDLIRCSLICGAFVAAVFIPIVQPLAKWFGATPETIDMGFEYILPLLIGSFETCIYLTVGGCLQGEGRTMLYGIQNMAALILNMACLDPLFLFCTKWGIRSASIATILSEVVPTVVVICLYYKGKFTIKPHPRDLLKKFTPHTWRGLKIGASQLISQLSIMIPAILVRKYLGNSVGKDYNDAMSGYTAAVRYSTICAAVIMGISMGFLPAGCYSYCSSDIGRWFKLCFHMYWICGAWGLLTMIISWSIPKQLSLMFASGEGYLKWATPMMQIMNALGVIGGVRYNTQSLLQSIKMGKTAMILSLINQFGAIIMFTMILYYTDPHNGTRLIWAYSLSTAFGTVSSGIVLIFPLKKMWKIKKENELDNDQIELSDDEDEGEDKEESEKAQDDLGNPQVTKELFEPTKSAENFDPKNDDPLENSEKIGNDGQPVGSADSDSESHVIEV